LNDRLSFVVSDQAADSVSLPLVLPVATADLEAIDYNNYDDGTYKTLHSKTQLCDRGSSSSGKPALQSDTDSCTESTMAWPHAEFELLQSYP